MKLDDDDAIRWLTANPAWALGIDGQVGTLEPGKRADVVVWSESPLSTYARAELVYIDGRVVFDRAHVGAPWSDFELGVRGDAREAGGQVNRSLGVLAAVVAAVCVGERGPSVAQAEEKSRTSPSRTRRCTSPGTTRRWRTRRSCSGAARCSRWGRRWPVPPDARTIDARGKVVTPGFIDVGTDVGVVDIDLEAASATTPTCAAR